MLKLLTRNLFAAVVLLLAFAAPSAFASNHSHHARSRALRHRTNRRDKGRGKARRGSRAVRLVTLRDAATTATTALLGEAAVEPHADYLGAGETEAFRLQA